MELAVTRAYIKAVCVLAEQDGTFKVEARQLLRSLADQRNSVSQILGAIDRNPENAFERYLKSIARRTSS